MRVIAAVLAVSVLLACSAERAPSTEGPRGVALVPDTQTVDGVLEMRHSADALERAPQWTLDPVPIVVIDGGEELDFTHIYRVSPLADGRFIVGKTSGGSELMVFGTDGRPERMLARKGQGPGELMAALEPLVLAGDTILVVDEANGTVNWYQPDSGLLRSARAPGVGRLRCLVGSGLLSSGHRIGVWSCGNPDGTVRLESPVATFAPDGGQVDTVAYAPSTRVVMFEIRQGASRFEVPQLLRLGQFTTVAAIDSTIVVADGLGGYVVRLLAADGTPRGRIVMAIAPVLVTEAIKHAAIAHELMKLEARLESEAHGTPNDETRRRIIEAPTADTLPAYDRVWAGEDGVFWVTDYTQPADTTWAATAFRVDGTIIGRVVGRQRYGAGSGAPVWFGRDRVIVREVDEDGVVRFGVYGVRR